MKNGASLVFCFEQGILKVEGGNFANEKLLKIFDKHK